MTDFGMPLLSLAFYYILTKFGRSGGQAAAEKNKDAEEEVVEFHRMVPWVPAFRQRAVLGGAGASLIASVGKGGRLIEAYGTGRHPRPKCHSDDGQLLL